MKTLDSVIAERDEALALLRALVEVGPNNEDEFGSQCWYCGGNRKLLTGATVPHKDDCPWIRAKVRVG